MVNNCGLIIIQLHTAVANGKWIVGNGEITSEMF